jgi:hypothetical protein
MQNRVSVVAALVVSFLWGAQFTPALSQQPYVGDPDPERPTLHVQPPIVSPASRVAGPRAPASVINGIT